METHENASTSPSMTRRSLLRGGAALAAGSAAYPLLGACGSGASHGGGAGPTTVSVRFNWTVKGEFSPFFVAREKGFYEEAGINVKLQEGKSGTQAVQVVGSGRDDFGYIPSIQVVDGVNKDVPITTIGTMGRYTGMCWAAWPDVQLNGPKALEGNTVSISSSSTFFQVWPGFQQRFQPNLDKINVVQPSPSARNGLFLRRKVDIMADIFYANDWVILRAETDKELNLLRMSDLDFDPLGYLLVANESLRTDSPDTVRRFTQATLRGFRYTIDNPDEVVDIMTRLFADRSSREVFDGQIRNMLDLLLRDPGLGVGTEEIWQQSLGILNQSGLIDDARPLDQYYTNEFVR